MYTLILNKCQNRGDIDITKTKHDLAQLKLDNFSVKCFCFLPFDDNCTALTWLC